MINGEDEKIKRILEGNMKGVYPDEERIVKKAVPFNSRRQNLKHFMFVDNDRLLGDLKQIYPAAVSIFIVNNDERDSENVPRVTCRKLRNAVCTVHKTRGYQGRLQYEEVRGVSASWQSIICVVENGFVTVKASNISMGGN